MCLKLATVFFEFWPGRLYGEQNIVGSIGIPMHKYFVIAFQQSQATACGFICNSEMISIFKIILIANEVVIGNVCEFSECLWCLLLNLFGWNTSVGRQHKGKKKILIYS